MAMKLVKNLKAVSPLIATIILIAITIAGGLLVYALFTSTAGVGSAKAQVQIDTMDLVKPTEGDVVFTMTLKNGGNKPADWINVTLGDEDEAVVMEAPAILQPGQTVNYIVNPAEDYIIGNAYLVTIEVGYTDGSTSSIVASVSCRS